MNDNVQVTHAAPRTDLETHVLLEISRSAPPTTRCAGHHGTLRSPLRNFLAARHALSPSSTRHTHCIQIADVVIECYEGIFCSLEHKKEEIVVHVCEWEKTEEY